MTLDARAPLLTHAQPIRFTAVASRGALLLAAFGIPFVMACLRIAEAPDRPIVWLRLGISLAAIAIVAFARRRSIAQRVILAFALEAASGAATLCYIDVPYIDAHAPQIAHAVMIAYARATHRDITSDLRIISNAL